MFSFNEELHETHVFSGRILTKNTDFWTDVNENVEMSGRILTKRTDFWTDLNDKYRFLDGFQ